MEKYHVYRKMADGSIQSLSRHKSLNGAIHTIERLTRLISFGDKILYYYCLKEG